ncbi:hypothetical protein SAMN05216598_4034 [Pseudomonas asplenii]|uniref:Uncharacterized protein n=1 Tax=Pseudomonas asplenii TaxID=53407 RepID=A0A1H1XSG8_9PSED|nr:hypothetical protein [Pseudomonas asplenii]SDT11809.1 hypothetical protein SAMN05216598_4034 [Pseudomonas asplenii]
MTNHVIDSQTITAEPDDTLEITRWPGSQLAGDKALFVGNIPGQVGQNIPCYTAEVVRTTVGSVHVVKVTVPDIPRVFYSLYLNTGGAFVRVIGVQLR